MPTHDYQCQKCKKVFEFSKPFGSSDHPDCPECKSKKTEKLFAPPSIQFKGKGFYKTDSQDAPKEEKTEQEVKPESKAETKPEKSSESTKE